MCNCPPGKWTNFILVKIHSMKTLKTFILSLCFGSFTAQTQVLLNADFNLGLPAGWGMNPAGSWTVHPFFGTGMSKCLYTEEMNTASTTVSFYSTPLNLSGINTLTITFKAACTKNNFLIPNVAVFYDSGSGRQLIARWGSGFTSPTTYTLDDVADYVPPLDTANIKWVSCTHTLSAPSGTNVSFYFDAEMINAGYVLLDDISLAGKTNTVATNVPDIDSGTGVLVPPNPVENGSLTITGQNLTNVSLFDVSGREIKVNHAFQPGKISLDLHSLTPGLYFIRFYENKKAFAKRVLVR